MQGLRVHPPNVRMEYKPLVMSSIQNSKRRWKGCGSADEFSIWQYEYRHPPLIRVQFDNLALNSGEDGFSAKRHYQRRWPFCGS